MAVVGRKWWGLIGAALALAGVLAGAWIDAGLRPLAPQSAPATLPDLAR